MKTMTIRDRMTVSCPDGFLPLSEKDLAGVRYYKKAPDLALADKERHIRALMGFQELSLLPRLILSEKDMIKNAEKLLKKQLKGFGFRTEGFSTRRIGGKNAQALRYTYAAQGIDMVGEYILIKEGAMLWYFHFFFRQAQQDESR